MNLTSSGRGGSLSLSARDGLESADKPIFRARERRPREGETCAALICDSGLIGRSDKPRPRNVISLIRKYMLAEFKRARGYAPLPLRSRRDGLNDGGVPWHGPGL